MTEAQGYLQKYSGFLSNKKPIYFCEVTIKTAYMCDRRNTLFVCVWGGGIKHHKRNMNN